MSIGRQIRSRRKEAPADEVSGEIDAMRSCAVRKEAVVADADEAGRKHMEQKAAEKLVGIEGHELLSVAVRVIAIAKADMLSIKGDDSRVTDGDAMGVAGEIRENLCWSSEGWFAVDDPFGGCGPCKEQVESDRVGEHSFGKLERSLAPRVTDKADQQRSKASREHPDGKKERGLPSRAPLPAISRKPAARNDAVDVGVQGQGLSPGMKHAQAARLDLKTAAGDIDERRTGGSE